MTNEHELEVMQEAVAALEAANLKPRLIGGLAVQLLMDDVHSTDEALADMDPAEPRALASLGRATDDVDLVVPAGTPDAAARALGGTRDPRMTPPPVRVRIHGTPVDLIEALPEPGPFITLGTLLAILGELEADLTRTIRHGIELAHPAALVVLKARAWTDRYLPHDLADIARLALRDPEVNHEARDGLAIICPKLPQAILRNLDAVHEAFASIDGKGPSAYITIFQAEIPGLELGGTDEDEVRRVVSSHAVELLSRRRSKPGP